LKLGTNDNLHPARWNCGKLSLSLPLVA